MGNGKHGKSGMKFLKKVAFVFFGFWAIVYGFYCINNEWGMLFLKYGTREVFTGSNAVSLGWSFVFIGVVICVFAFIKDKFKNAKVLMFGGGMIFLLWQFYLMFLV